jgi:diacylglycerol kinase (ATP)
MPRPLIESFRDAFRGIFHVLRTQRNARIHLVATLVVVGAGLGLGLGPLEWAVLVLTISLVLAMEMVNTALEALADAAVEGYHPLVGIAKDVAAGAVLATALGAVVVGLLIFVPRLR